MTKEKSPPLRDLADLLKNSPWKVMFAMTMIHFCILAFRGNALYNYYHHYADKAALFDWVQKLGLTAPALAAGAPASGGILEWMGYIVHGTRNNLASSNVTDVAQSIINMIGTGVTMIVILLSPPLARKFGKKAIAVAGFGLSTFTALAFYLLKPTDVGSMIALTVIGSIFYAPTIPLVWAIYADVADYSEWKIGRRFTGIVFATICFALKAGLALGNSTFLWTMALVFNYDPKLPDAPEALKGFRICSGIVVGILFAVCTVLLICYKINKRMTIQMADELAERRRKFAAQTP